MARFIHLRTHTEYSLCSGAIKIKDFVKQLKNNNIPAAAMTDTHNMFGALEYSVAASNEGIQPIIGCEVVFDMGKMLNRDGDILSDSKREEKFCKMVLLAKDNQGFLNLISILSQSYLKREQNIKPHVNIGDLVAKKGGIIVLSGGVEGPIGKALISGNYNTARDITDFLKTNLGENFYMEIQRHGLKDEIDTEDNFIKLAYDYNIPLVATNNCHFYAKEMFEAQDALSCIADARYVSETNRPKLTPEHYFKSEDEMIELFKDLPEAIENSVNIAQQISVMAHTRKPTLPHFDLPEGVSEAEEMARIAREGLEERLKQKFITDDIVDTDKQNQIREQYFNQLEFEIGIINQMDFPGYFLICADFIVWSKTNGVPIGPGRGSGAGSMVAWAMKITNLDPIKFSLFFERFLNPERVSMPDFDVDFCQRGRARSIEYVQNKYGKDSVAQIITFGKLQSKAVIKDVGRVLEMGYSEVDKISKTIPFDTGLEDALELDSDLRSRRQSDPEISKLFDIAIQLEGLNRHSSVHAAGLVIGDKPLEQICPLYFDDSADMPVVQYNMKYCEKVGLVKFDFLGLKTLTVIKDAVDYVYEITGEKIDIDNIRLDDKKTFDLLKRADSLAVFQIESSGMIGMLKQIKPDNIEDIIALISLYRPGPMGNIPTYINRKHGKEKVEYMHPKMEPILKDTYGIIIYQEQVMNIAKVLAGYTLGGADLLRRAMGKKIKEEMDRQRDVFVKGCKEFSDIDEELSNEIFDLLAKFAEYGFNKAHAAAYAVISYQTAYLKAHYPVEFMTATLNMEIIDTDKIYYYLQDIKRHNIKVLPPDVNLSDNFFKVELIDKINPDKEEEYYHGDKELAIRYGLCAIKGVGQEVIDVLVKDRRENGDFSDIFDFCSRLGNKVVNKKTMESLAKSGSFDKIHDNRRQINDSCEILSNYAKTSEEEKSSPQISLFGDFNSGKTLLPKLCDVDDWIGYDRCQKEFEAFGFYLNNHPLDTIKDELSSKGISFYDEIENKAEINEIPDGSIVKIAGVVISSSIKSNDKGKYAYISVSDPTSLVEVTLFNGDMITQHKDWLDDKEHKQLVFECSIKSDESGLRLNVKDFWLLDDYLKNTKEGTEKVRFIKRFNFNDIKNKKENVFVERKKNVFINNAVIKVSNEKCIDELERIINKTKNSGVDKFTNIEIVIDDMRIKLPMEFCLTDVEIGRIKNTYGVEGVEVE